MLIDFTKNHYILSFLLLGINARLMDPFTIKPIDSEAILTHGKACGGRILVVEDHYPEVSHDNSKILFFIFSAIFRNFYRKLQILNLTEKFFSGHFVRDS